MGVTESVGAIVSPDVDKGRNGSTGILCAHNSLMMSRIKKPILKGGNLSDK